MTEQPVEPMTEQAFLGNTSPIRLLPQNMQPAVPTPHRQAYLPNGHRLPLQSVILQDIESAGQERFKARVDAVAEWAEANTVSDTPFDDTKEFPLAEPDLWFNAEKQADRALIEIQAGNINAGIAYLQAALAFAQNHRHSLTEETTR